MELSQLSIIVQQLISLPQETEWVEFKQNNEKPETIENIFQHYQIQLLYTGKIQVI
jgi:hypothetical protein